MLIKDSALILNKIPEGFAIRLKNSKNPFLLKTLYYYEELASIVEILKVEGWWNSAGRISVSNKSPELVSLFNDLLTFHKIKTYKNALIKVKIPSDWEKDGIKVLKEGKELKFYFGRSGFTTAPDRIVFHDKFEPTEYKIKQAEKELVFKTKASENELSANLTGIGVYGVIRASNKAFVYFLNSVLKEKSKSKEIRINKELKDARPDLIAKVFARLVDCEGSIRFGGLTRNIHIRMANELYLKDWQSLLEKIGIKSGVYKVANGMTGLVITCNQNFTKLAALGFELCHEKKKDRFRKILESYGKHQFERNTAQNTYLSHIIRNPNISALELARKLKKGKRVVSYYLQKLADNKLVKIKVVGQKYFYSAVDQRQRTDAIEVNWV
ncbi:MAG: LAGLIDADG family homing endonuclease [archaeon]